ncbi:MAG: DUF308 domain-containing protein [Prevotella sp.]|nr:DUF308 domain-containing protein [Candidatus Prevotella equi]
MKIIHYSIFRALCSIAVGALLVKYRQDMVTWMTMLIGALFFFSGLIAVIMAFARKRAEAKLFRAMQEYEGADDAAPRKAKLSSGSVVAGCGSMLLGIILAAMPQTFVDFLVYILAAFLILGAVQQFFTLATARHYGAVGFTWWVMPALLFAAGCVAVFKPSVIASFPLLFIGCAMIVYGVIECANALKTRNNRKQAETNFNLNGKPDFSDAEEVSYEEVK